MTGVTFLIGTTCILHGEEASSGRPPRFTGPTPAAAVANDSAKDTVVLTVWELSIANSTDNKKGDEKAKLAALLDNMPTEFTSSSNVREFIQGLRDAGRLRSLRELRLSALDGQSATVQAGANKPQVTGSNCSPRGRANSVTFRQTGTTIDARPSIDSEKRIRVQFEYNMSDLQKSDGVALVDDGDGKTLFADEIVTRQFKTTTRLKNGAAAVIRCDSSIALGDKSDAGHTELIILCGAIVREQRSPIPMKLVVAGVGAVDAKMASKVGGALDVAVGGVELHAG